MKKPEDRTERFPILAGRADWERAVDSLRDYLDRVGFHAVYKYLVSVNFYSFLPSRFNAGDQAFIAGAARAAGNYAGFELVGCLTARASFPLGNLAPADRETAARLAAIGLLRIDGGTVLPGPAQLLSVKERYLLVDAAVHFPLGRVHDIYIGLDSFLLLYYLNRPAGEGSFRGLDLCSGSGVAALGLAGFCREATATDIDPAALSAIRVNARLNGLGRVVTALDEDLGRTLESGDAFDVVVCNPPFVPFPEGLDGPVYAHGPGSDGQDYLRLLLRRVPGLLTERGEALFVSDLPGGDGGPLMIGELRRAAEAAGVGVDLYIDSRVRAADRIQPMSAYIARLHPDRDAADIAGRLEELVLRRIGARFYYLSTIRLRRGVAPGLRVFNRYL